MTHAAITTLGRQLHEWADRLANRKFLQQDQEAQLLAALGNPARRAQVHVAAWMLGTWHLGHGLCLVLDGEAGGFGEARLGQGLRRCSLLLRARHQGAATQRAGRSRLPFSRLHGAWTALLGLALGDPGADPLYELLRDEPESSFAEGEHLPLFVRELLVLHAGQRPTLTPRLGPYHEVLMHWRGESRMFAQRLADLLDLHLEAVRSKEPLFDDPACWLYPVEVLAVRAVREWLELPMPKVEHPLMFTNLGQMVPARPWPRHELVQRLEQELRQR
ncbi:MAG: hypothetical protein WAT39_07825 [Planctomycetota bacterium]